MTKQEKDQVIYYIRTFYGVTKKQAEKWYKEYSEERRKLLLDIYRDQCKKAFYYD